MSLNDEQPSPCKTDSALTLFASNLCEMVKATQKSNEAQQGTIKSIVTATVVIVTMLCVVMGYQTYALLRYADIFEQGVEVEQVETTETVRSAYSLEQDSNSGSITQGNITFGGE